MQKESVVGSKVRQVWKVNTLFNLEGTGRRMLEKGKRADGASANNIKAQRSGFNFGRRSNEAIRSFRPEAKPEAGKRSLLRRYGGLAQLVERLLCKQEVSGSIPLISTKYLKKK